jgi:hypothetical protein
VHVLIRVIRHCILDHRDLVAEFSGKANGCFDAGMRYLSYDDELMYAVLLELQLCKHLRARLQGERTPYVRPWHSLPVLSNCWDGRCGVSRPVARGRRSRPPSISIGPVEPRSPIKGSKPLSCSVGTVLLFFPKASVEPSQQYEGVDPNEHRQGDRKDRGR